MKRPITRRQWLGALSGILGLGGVSQSAAATSPPADRGKAGRPDRLESAEAASPLPGPSVLYDEPVTAPQFQTTGIWEADSTRVSGTEAYVDGEYLYQGWAYDDYGASTSVAATPPDHDPDYNEFGAMSGDIVYPTDQDVYAGNAGDLLEFRAQPRGDSVVYRLTLTTMTASDVAGIAIGIDRGDGSRTDWGYGLGELEAPVEDVIVVNGEYAEFDGKEIDASVDLERNQIEVEIPLSPGEETWRHYLVTGLYDRDMNAFKQVQNQPSETHPGGANGQNPPPVFDVGFRTFDQEPMGGTNTRFVDAQDGRLNPDEGVSEVEETAEVDSRGSGFGHWREHAQAKALSDRDISQFYADIDFGKLQRGVTERNVPETGYLNLLYSSRYDLGDGVDNNVLLGRVQPYTLYIPEGYDGAPAPLHFVLPGSTSTYNIVGTLMPNMLNELGDNRGAMILSPEARGPERPFFDEAELDVFEALNDAINRFSVDLTKLTISGYSRGGYGTYKLASHYPDLFSRAFSIVGTSGAGQLAGSNRPDVTPIADNLRHVPLLMWAGMADELVPYPIIAQYQQRLQELEYRHRLDTFPDYDHFRFGIEDEWSPAREFLGVSTRETQPRRITYRSIPGTYNEKFDLIHDHAYWISDIDVSEGADQGLVDVVSEAVSERSPNPTAFYTAARQPTPNHRRGVRWRSGLTDSVTRNRLELELTNLDSLTVWAEEANLDTSREIEIAVETNQPTTVTLAGSFATKDYEFPSGTTERTVQITRGSSQSG